jgi:hypothetical protein
MGRSDAQWHDETTTAHLNRIAKSIIIITRHPSAVNHAC